MTDGESFAAALRPRSSCRVTVSVRTLRAALEAEDALMAYTRAELEMVLADELKLSWPNADSPSDTMYSKQALIVAYTPEWSIPQLIGLARCVEAELTFPHPSSKLCWLSTTPLAA